MSSHILVTFKDLRVFQECFFFLFVWGVRRRVRVIVGERESDGWGLNFNDELTEVEMVLICCGTPR